MAEIIKIEKTIYSNDISIVIDNNVSIIVAICNIIGIIADIIIV